MAEPATENATTSRKEKRKASKKAKRQLLRRQMAADDHALLSDPAELLRLRSAELDEAERSLRERTLWEEREKAWLTNLDDQRRLAAETREPPTEKTDGDDDDDGWEFVEVGPPEIVWQGNEIILKKKKIRVPKTDSPKPKDADRPISNPLPPEPDQNSSSVSGHNSIETVAQQVPNFGTEQDKAHCPFHLKTGVCRFGQRCSRVHFYPDKSCTLLIKNMYNGPGLAWEQDEGLEYTDEEVERSYEEFYEDVHTEFLKFGEIVNFKVCRNGSFHLRGNVYVHFKALDSAVLAYRFINARYFAGKQVSCEFVNVTRWKVAICGEYMKTRFKTCSRGTACNFIHCFRNPGGEYEWSDNDKPPPRYWVKKMIALFGYSDESAHEQQTAQDNWNQPNSYGKTSTADVDRHHSRRSKSRESDYLYHSSSGRRKDNEDYVPRRRDQLQYTSNDKEKTGTLKENTDVDRVDLKDYHPRKRKIHHFDAGESYDDDRDRETCHDGYLGHTRKSSRSSSRNDKNDFHESGSDGDWLGRDSEKESCHNYSRKSSKYQNKTEKRDDHGYHESKTHEVDRDGRGKERVEEKYRDTRKYSSRHSGKDKNRERTGRERDVDRHSRRKSSVSYRKFDGFSKLYSGERNPVETTEVETDPNEKSDFSEGSELANRSNAAADHSHKGIGKLHSYDGDLRTDKSNDSSGSSKDGEQCRVYDLDSRCKYDVEIDKHDHWEPEPEPEPAFL